MNMIRRVNPDTGIIEEAPDYQFRYPWSHWKPVGSQFADGDFDGVSRLQSEVAKLRGDLQGRHHESDEVSLPSDLALQADPALVHRGFESIHVSISDDLELLAAVQEQSSDAQLDVLAQMQHGLEQIVNRLGRLDDIASLLNKIEENGQQIIDSKQRSEVAFYAINAKNLDEALSVYGFAVNLGLNGPPLVFAEEALMRMFIVEVKKETNIDKLIAGVQAVPVRLKTHVQYSHAIKLVLDSADCGVIPLNRFKDLYELSLHVPSDGASERIMKRWKDEIAIAFCESTNSAFIEGDIGVRLNQLRDWSPELSCIRRRIDDSIMVHRQKVLGRLFQDP